MSTSPPSTSSSDSASASGESSSIEWELRSLAKDNADLAQCRVFRTERAPAARTHADLAQYLLAFLVRNGYRPSESARRAMALRAAVVEWLDEYVRGSPAPLRDLAVLAGRCGSLRDLAVRAVRSHVGHAAPGRGNVMHALRQLRLPSRINNLLLIVNALW